jgi:uncharacterized protein (DUF1697 family)
MKRHIALLRGINVGKAKRVAMADLRALMEDLGHARVRTLLNSGNAVFDAPAGSPATIAAALKAAILARTGVDCEVIVKTAGELSAAITEHPLRRHHDDDARLLVLFTQDAAGLAALAPLEAVDWSPEAFARSAHAAWLWCANGVNDSPLAKAAGRRLKATGTTRNWATVCKLEAMAREA